MRYPISFLSFVSVCALLAFPVAAQQTVPYDQFMRGSSDMFRTIDRNGDGVITYQEWMVGSEARFRRQDTNHDGVWNGAEAQGQPAATRPAPRSRQSAVAAEAASAAPVAAMPGDSSGVGMRGALPVYPSVTRVPQPRPNPVSPQNLPAAEAAPAAAAAAAAEAATVPAMSPQGLQAYCNSNPQSTYCRGHFPR